MTSKQIHEKFSENGMKRKRQKSMLQSTLKCDKKWTKVFREYLEKKDCQNTEFWTYLDDELDRLLSKFWFKVHTSKMDENGENEIYQI